MMMVARLWVVSIALAMVQAAGPADSPPTLIKAGRVLDVRAGAYRANQGIWIENGRVRQVGAFDDVRAAAPRTVAVIDLSRAAVLPGLIDVHTHLLAAMDPSLDPIDNLILTLSKDSPAKRALQGAVTAREMIEGGFTTVRSVGHSGVDGDIALRDAIRRGWIPGPRIVAAGRKLTLPGGQAIASLTSAAQGLVDIDFLPVASPDEARRAVLENVRLGADIIKVVADDGARVIDGETMKAIADQAHRAGAKVAVHATTPPGIQSAIDGAVDSIEHADAASDAQFQAMREKKIVFVPTVWPIEWLPISRTLAARPDVETLKKLYVSGERSKVDRARKAGVTIAFGSDMWFGFPGKTRAMTTRAVLESLQTAFGMPAADVLRSATVIPADLLGLADVSGAIETGKSADVIAVDGDPLTNVTDLEKLIFVMKAGAVIRDESRAKPPQS